MALEAKAHPEEVTSLVFAEKQPSVGGVLPSLGYIGCETSACSVLHHQGQVLLSQNGFLGVDNTDVPLS